MSGQRLQPCREKTKCQVGADEAQLPTTAYTASGILAPTIKLWIFRQGLKRCPDTNLCKEMLVGMDDQNHPGLNGRQAAVIALQCFNSRVMAGGDGVKRLPGLNLMADRRSGLGCRSWF